MSDHLPKARVMRDIPPEWEKLMYLVERIGFGEITIKVQNGKPEIIESGFKNVKLTGGNDEFKERLKMTPLLDP